MTEQYEPGTVATATVRGVPNVRVIRRDHRLWPWVSGIAIAGSGNRPTIHCDDEVTDVRPLVVLDIPVAELSCVAENLRASANYMGGHYAPNTAALLEGVANQIAAHNRPPKPPEPTGLGAVVEDAEGRKWVRTLDADEPWVDSVIAGDWIDYDRINVVRVLSEGVSS